jgi:nucleotide-binding universal stress UspA family protein
VTTAFVSKNARSSAAGLLDLVEERGARLLTLGSSTAGVFGHVVLGSVSSRLLHSSPVPVALAPRGFRCKPGARVARVTVAYGGSSSEDLLVAAATVASRVGVPLRLVSFAVRAMPEYTTTLGTEPEQPVLDQWMAGLRKTAQEALTQVRQLDRPPEPIDCVIGRGNDWSEALDDVEWRDGDVLVVGSSALGPLARVFLGSRAAKIIRHSPVPVVVVARGTEEEAAHA